jgi:hypothetical protein
MRVPIKCETCGEEIVFDIEGVNVFNPGDLTSMDPYVKPLFDEFGRERVLRALDEIVERKGNYKKVRFFEKCSKCGLETIYIHYCKLM